MLASPTVVSPLTRQIADAVGEACRSLNLQPVDLTHGVFVRWLKKEKELSDEDLREVRLHLQRVGGFQNLRNAFFVGLPSPALIEREEMKGIARLSKANAINLAYDELFLTRFGEVMKKVSSELSKTRVPVLGKKTNSRTKTQRIVTLMLSDLHFGSKLDPRELPFKYEFEEESRALASVIVRLCDFKKDYRDETELIVWIGGDIIRGSIHDRQAGAPLAEQCADAMHLLVQALRVVANCYKKVTVYCSSGNHDRDEGRHPRSASDQKWDSRATVIYMGLKLATNHLPNVTVNIPRTPHCEWEVFGHPVYGTHGDDNLNVGNPAKQVPISSIDTQMKTINLARVDRGLKPYEVFNVGHVHQGFHIPLPSGELIVNPCLIPVDGYAQSVGYQISKPGQTIYESTKDHPVGDLRFLAVKPEMFKDKALDKVITPFKDF